MQRQFHVPVGGDMRDNYSAVNLVEERADGRFDGGHTFSFTAGEEIKSGNQSLWCINTKVLWLGGFRDKPIDLEYSRTLQTTIYEQHSAYFVKMKDYFRPDLRIYWKKSRAHYSRTLSIDLQNVSGTKNEAYRYFDKRKDDVVTQYQLGLIPVVGCRWEF
ncbi:hypothetical protein LZD49_09860 [Dyadobacter sp. CY261]|uniref:hypothetical protein n=1 Tax=Dyadobacter sp. CY261 TaxID=2907203 RepID=UPI001F43C6C5|nr:hypothetical protein [Dyadobacter sp. CY261]MCF0070778.1 hypothetical protein [Dyadobacter sp. CY261]